MKNMKKMIALTFSLLLMTAVALAQAAQPEMKKKEAKPAKAAAAPKTDPDVQKCITDKFATSKTITNGAATVANGEATLTGEAKNAGSKGGATKTAQGCGAKKVTNNITVAAPAAKAADKKPPAPPKKP